ncbi:hypothetical protein EDM80_14770 [bacterium]|nr:MAG: hypothetical protein EDM80_14770 [bacterium]
MMLAGGLDAADFDFELRRVSPTHSEQAACALQVTWDMPDHEVIAFEVFLFQGHWPANIDAKMPHWRAALTAGVFDEEDFAARTGARIERYRFFTPKRRPVGFLDRRDRYDYTHIAVLLVDAQGQRRGPANLRWAAVAPHITRSDLWFLPSYQPWLGTFELSDEEDVKLEWTLPEVPAEDSVKRLHFLAFTGRYWPELVSSGVGGIDAVLDGRRQDCLPLRSSFAAIHLSGWLEKLDYSAIGVVAELESGLKLLCPFKRQGKVLGVKATEVELQKLRKINPERVAPRGLPARAELARRSEHWPRMEAAFAWLADHQNADGSWTGSGFLEASKRKGARITHNAEYGRPGEADADLGAANPVALTSLCILAFTASGQGPRHGPYASTVRKAMLFVRKAQGNHGGFAGDEQFAPFFGQALATLAMAELYALSGDIHLRQSAQAALDFTLQRRIPFSGWGPAPGVQQPSLFETCMHAFAFLGAQQCGIGFECPRTWEGVAKALEWLARQPKSKPAENAEFEELPLGLALQALARMASDDPKWRPGSESLAALLKPVQANTPAWRGSKLDYLYWSFGALALWQATGPASERWLKATYKILLETQRGFRQGEVQSSARLLDEHGSWDANDKWSGQGGRVYSTAINLLTLQTPWRYSR